MTGLEGAFKTGVELVTRLVEAAGILVIVIGMIIATIRYGKDRIKPPPGKKPVEQYRARLGRSILVGLEFLVAADIIQTVAVKPSLSSLAALGIVVLIRTFLSFALEIEINGQVPWRKHLIDRSAT